MALAEHRIDRKHASILLYALQIASQNAKNADQIVSSEPIAELTRTEQGEELAPEGATSHPQQEESIADILMREVNRKREEWIQQLSPDQAPQPTENKDLTRKSWGEGGGCPSRRRARRLLKLQQPPFALHSPAVAGQLPIATHHPMAKLHAGRLPARSPDPQTQLRKPPPRSPPPAPSLMASQQSHS